jgi:hypothetical protein
MKCKICNSAAEKFAEIKVLQKYPVSYFHCANCRFIQTEEPYWLQEAYESVITSLDIGLVDRNLYLREIIPGVMDKFFPRAERMIDYGGGYGMFVRMMRDKGYNFFRQDIYCGNIFAKNFDVTDVGYKTYDVLTAFEVFEHLPDPLGEIEKMFSISENIVFTTVLRPSKLDGFKDWWYVSPLTGQHIAFYSAETLNFIAKKFNKKIYSNEFNLHVLTGRQLDAAQAKKVLGYKKNSVLNKLKGIVASRGGKTAARESLLPGDYQFIERKLKKNLD